MLEIIRIPMKFHKAISRLSNEHKAYILSSIFSLSADEAFTKRDDELGDLLELIHFENVKMGEKASAKKNTGVSEKTTPPMVTPQVDTKEKGNEKKQKRKETEPENIYDLKSDFLKAKDIPIEKRNATEVLLVYFFELGYEPEKNETMEGFRDWLTEIAKLKAKSAEDLIEISTNWYTYWKAQKEPVKNHKVCFLGSNGFKIK